MSNTECTLQVHKLFSSATSAMTYIIHSSESRRCVIIDSVLDYDHFSGRVTSTSAQKVIDYVKEKQLEVEWILETHVHADHMSAAAYLKSKLGGKTGIGEKIVVVQKSFSQIFNLGKNFPCNGSQFDSLFVDEEEISVGSLVGKVFHVPGHTPACVAYQFSDVVFVGDTLLMPDIGSSRCDFPGGNAKSLYASIKKILSLPSETRLFLCHDYPPESRDLSFSTTVGNQRLENIHVRDGITEEEFVDMRRKRDASLSVPALIYPSLQVNIRAGSFPDSEDNGTSYLKIPLELSF